jgi:hypothetical protein
MYAVDADLIASCLASVELSGCSYLLDYSRREKLDLVETRDKFHVAFELFFAAPKQKHHLSRWLNKVFRINFRHLHRTTASNLQCCAGSMQETTKLKRSS